jgi:heptosyltransferase III
MSLTRARFLVLRGGAIGDFILTLPAITMLRERWPDAEIEIIGYPHVAELAKVGGLVDRVGSLDKAGIAQFFSRSPVFSDDMVAYIRSFDLVISWLHDRDGTVRDNLLLAGARQVLYGSPLVDSGHAIDHLLKPLEALALYGEQEYARLSWPIARREEGLAHLATLGVGPHPLAIHPGSGSAKKNWAAQEYAALINRISGETSWSPYVILGEADEALREHFQHIPVWTGASLLETASVLSASQAFIGNDSGITHLAGALGLPVIALYGPTDPETWAPRGRHVRIVFADDGDLSRLHIEQVWSHVQTWHDHGIH